MKLLRFLKKEPVLSAALLLAAVSLAVVRPSFQIVIEAVDFRVLALLFCLMIIIAAFRALNVLDAIAFKLLRICHTETSLFLVLVFLVFASSMIVTNDVALLTFVPISLIICRKALFTRKKSAVLVVLETLAANLGSCMTPMGNPQNLFLYSYYDMQPGDFFPVVLKLGIPSVLLLLVAVFQASDSKKKLSLPPVRSIEKKKEGREKVLLAATVSLLMYTLGAVFHAFDYRAAFAACVLFYLVLDFRLFKKVDYCLLLTFTGFFIFTGTISTVPAVSDFLRGLLSSEFSCYLTGIAASQVISNVPAALLLAGFTGYSKVLVLAVNVGGLGTIIASLASVISYKLYSRWCEEEPVQAGADASRGGDGVTSVRGESSACVETGAAGCGKPVENLVSSEQVVENSPVTEKSVENPVEKVSYMGIFTIYNLLFLVVTGLVAWGLYCL